VRRLIGSIAALALAVCGCAGPPAEQAGYSPAPPPMGWNSWNSGIPLDEHTVTETIDAMVSSGMRDAGYRYVDLDAGWAAPTRTDDGRLTADPGRFPHGIAPLARYAHDRGLLLGLYASPYDQTCGQDPRIASLGHERTDADTFASWGVDFLKYDWCRADADHAAQRAAFTAMGAALRDTGRHIVYSINPNSSDDHGAGTRFDWSGVADEVRSSGDLVPVWRDVMPPLGPADPFAAGGINGVPDQVAAAVASPGNAGFGRDPDMLVVGLSWHAFVGVHPNLLPETDPSIVESQPGLTDDEARSHFSLWAMLGAPLIAGNDLRSMSPQTVAILTNREVIAVDQDPLLRPAHPLDAAQRVWARPLADGSVAVALVNTADTPADVATSVADAGLAPAPCFTVRDLWAHTSTTTTDAVLAARQLAPHAVRLLRVSGCAG
jgi:alpha-galactosidase